MRGGAHAALFLAAWGLTAAWIQDQAPLPVVGVHQWKFDHIERHRDDYTALFFGSSQMMGAAVPRAFDQRMGNRGHQTRSYNMALHGAVFHETDFMVREVLSMEPANLEWVFVELHGWSPRIGGDNAFTARAVFWHSLHATRAALRSVSLMEAGPIEKGGWAWLHLRHFMHRAGALGRGAEWLQAAVKDVPPRPRREGVFPGAAGWGTPRQRREVMSGRVGETEALGGVQAGFDEEWPEAIDAYNVDALADLVAAIRAAGAEPVFVVLPGSRLPFLGGLKEAGLLPAVLEFQDPAAHPELFRMDHWFDSMHLTTDGAQAFTVLLAEAFATMLDEQTGR